MDNDLSFLRLIIWKQGRWKFTLSFVLNVLCIFRVRGRGRVLLCGEVVTGPGVRISPSIHVNLPSYSPLCRGCKCSRLLGQDTGYKLARNQTTLWNRSNLWWNSKPYCSMESFFEGNGNFYYCVHILKSQQWTLWQLVQAWVDGANWMNIQDKSLF